MLQYPGCETFVINQATPPGSQPLPAPEPLIKVSSLAYLIWDLADFEVQEKFLNDFGLLVQSKDDQRLYMRSYSKSPYVYMARKAARTQFVGLGFAAATRDDLRFLSEACGTPIVKLDRPGGGEAVLLLAPDGIQVEVCFGIVDAPVVAAHVYCQPSNYPNEKLRINQGQRPPLRPSPVMKLGHCVLGTNNFSLTADWYMKHLGLIASDVVCLDDGSPNIAFMRLDKGDEPTDHHTLVISKGTGLGYQHSAYEVQDLDVLAQGQQFLKMKSHSHFWGLGRHILGSQLFDYWHDPSGFEFEHYADGDVFTSDHETGYHPFDPGNIYAWGQDMPKAFISPSTSRLLEMIKALIKGELSFGWLKQMKKVAARSPRPWL